MRSPKMVSQLSSLSRLSERYPKKRAFITGAGSGLGLAFAKELASNGWTIALTDLHQNLLDEAATIVSSIGGTPYTYKFDVTEYEAFRSAINSFTESVGGIDLGINNAGVGCAGLIDEQPIEHFRKVIDINLMGVVNGCHLFVPVMVQQKKGHILNVASAAAFAAAPRMAAYNISKAGVLALSETLRAELEAKGILISVLAPTYIRSNLGRDSLGSPEDKLRAQIIVEESQLTPGQVAREALQKVQDKQLYIVLPEDAKFLWRFKRFFPNQYVHYINLLVAQKEQQFQREMKKRKRAGYLPGRQPEEARVSRG
jgi:short-subunit dehydrogenase